MRILPSNTRNFLRLLKALCSWYVGDKKSTGGEGAQPPELEGLYQTFAHALYEAEIEIDNLNALANGGGRDWLARVVWSQSIQEANAFFLAGTRRRESEEVEQAFLLVQASFYRGCRKTKDVSACLDYGIRVVAPALVISRPQGQKERDEQNKALAYRMQLGREIPPVDVAGHLRAATWKWPNSRNAGYMRLRKRRRKDDLHVAIRGFSKSETEDKSKDFGVYRWWMALKREQVNVQQERDILPTLETFWSRAHKVSGQILALYFMTLRNEYGYEFPCIDLYQGLGNLAGLLHEVSRTTGRVDDTVRLFLERRCNETRSYPISAVDVERQDAGDWDNDDGLEEDGGPFFERSEKLELALTHWAQAARSLADIDRPPDSPPFYIPAPQIGSVFEGLERQLERMTNVDESGWSVGTMLERWTAAFWQNLLLVELEYRLGADFGAAGLSMRGVVTTTTEFERNLDTLEGRIEEWQPDDLRWRVPRNALLWLSCPVLLACCRKLLRDRIYHLVTMVATKLDSCEEQAGWARQLLEGIQACEEIFLKCSWNFAGGDRKDFDIHETWCSLFVAPGKSPGPEPGDYEAFEKETELKLPRRQSQAKDGKSS